MKTIKIKTVDNSKILKTFFGSWVIAFTLGKTIRCRGKYDDLKPETKNHENIHVAQYEKHGIIKFLYIYFIKEFSKSYREKTFEKEAYGNQDDLNYIQNNYKLIITK